MLDFKSLWDKSGLRGVRRPPGREIHGRYVAAFANADGGTLVLGVEDDGTPRGMATRRGRRGFPCGAQRRLRPAVKVSKPSGPLDGKQLFVVQVALPPKL